jgi:hypothetical protein
LPVTRWSAAALLALVLGLSGSASAPVPAHAQSRAQVTVTEQLIIRVPVRMRQITPAASMFRWKESKGPRCVPWRNIAGAALLSENSVDLILRDRRRVRAKLDTHCPELDYYYGFYISPNADGQICADRDAIRSRVGGQCGIERFRSLEAVRRD